MPRTEVIHTRPLTLQGQLSRKKWHIIRSSPFISAKNSVSVSMSLYSPAHTPRAEHHSEACTPRKLLELAVLLHSIDGVLSKRDDQASSSLKTKGFTPQQKGMRRPHRALC